MQATQQTRSLHPLFLMTAVLMIGYGAIFTLLAEIRNQFGFSNMGIGFIGGVAFIAGFVAQLGVGKLIDLGKGKLILRLGLMIAILGTSWMIVADTLAEWLIARGLFGFGSGCVRPAVRRLVMTINPEEVGRNMGRLSAYEMGGFLLGPIIASMLTAWLSMQLTFVVLTGLLVGMVPLVLKEDIPGAVNPDLAGIHLRLLSRPAMQSGLATGVAFYITVGVFEAIWAVFLSDLGASQMFIGLTMSFFVLPMIFIAPWAGALAHAHGPINITTISVGIAACCMLCYGVMDSIVLLCIPMAIHSIVDAFTMPANQLAVGMASGEDALATGQGLFGAVGMAVAAIAAVGGGIFYEYYGATMLWFASAFMMAGCLVYAWWRGAELRQPVTIGGKS